MTRTPALTVEELAVAVDSGEVDTVVLALTDMQGRLQGKRFHGPFFVERGRAPTAARAATTCSPSTST